MNQILKTWVGCAFSYGTLSQPQIVQKGNN